MCSSTWWSLLARNRFRIHPARWGLAFGASTFAAVNSFARHWENAWYRRELREAQVTQPPIFIVGHWRSGTTFLHELLVLDPRHGFPRTIDCMLPNQFLHCGDFISKYLGFFLPSQRPMDNMAAGFQRPQEDEFALMNMGVPSPYLTMAFPNHPPVACDYLDFEGVSAADLEAWKAALQEFLCRVQIRDSRRIVLKSPTHTGRLAVLAEMFPGAKFIYMARDPRSVFPSTVRLWKSLYESQALQLARHEGLEEYVFTCFERMDAAYQRDRDKVPSGSLCEVRYEDLAQDPLGQLQRVYDELELGEYDAARPHFEEHVAGLKEYRTNVFQLDDARLAEIEQRLGPFMQRYGYEPMPTAGSAVDDEAAVESGP